MFNFVRKQSQPMEKTTHLPIPHFFTHRMEVQAFTNDTGPPTLAMSIVGSQCFAHHSYTVYIEYVCISYYVYI